MRLRKKKNKLIGINPDEKINYNKNDLLDELHARFFQSYALTLDTADYIPQEYIDKVYKQIYKAQKKKYKEIFGIDKEYRKWFMEQLPELIAAREQNKLREQLQQKDSDDEQKQE